MRLNNGSRYPGIESSEEAMVLSLRLPAWSSLVPFRSVVVPADVFVFGTTTSFRLVALFFLFLPTATVLVDPLLLLLSLEFLQLDDDLPCRVDDSFWFVDSEDEVEDEVEVEVEVLVGQQLPGAYIILAIIGKMTINNIVNAVLFRMMSFHSLS